MRMPFFQRINSRGDTIVEVMVSMSILALVLGAAYATTNRSLRTGTDAGVRSQATSFAQQQVEILKAIALNNPEKIGTFKVGRPFCIDPATTVLKEVDTDLNGDGTNDACGLPVGSADPTQPYSLIVRYYPADAGAGLPKSTFVVTSQWPSSTTANEQSKVSLHYKPQDNFVTMNPSEISAPPPVETDLSAPNLPTITLTRSHAAVISPNSATITWNITKATTCTASSSPSSATWNGPIPVASNGTANNFRNTGPIPATSDATFTVQCTRTGAGSRTASVTVGSQRITSFTALPNPVAYNSFTDLSWASQHTSSCSGSGGSGGWAGSGKLSSGTQRINNMTASTTFNLACTGVGGTVSASRPVTVNVPPAPSASLWVDNGSIGHGGSTTLRWSVSGIASICNAWGSWGGNPSIPTGATGTGGLSGPGTYYYYMNCSGPGGTSPTAGVSVNVAGPPPPPPSCTSTAGGWRVWDGNWVQFSGGGGGCSFWRNSVVGDNGGGVWGPTWSPGVFCHTQSGYVHGWGWLSSADWCG